MTARPPPPHIVRALGPLIGQVVAQVNKAAPFAPAGTEITSWYRDRVTNARVGGLQDSQHLAALAFDVDHPDLRVLRPLGAILRSLGFTVVETQTHLHVQAFTRDFRVVDRLRRSGLSL